MLLHEYLWPVPSGSQLPLATYVSNALTANGPLVRGGSTGFSWLEAEVDYRGCEVLQPQLRNVGPRVKPKL